jgi:LemA protein
MTGFIVILGLIIICIVWFVSAYNGLVRSRQQAKNSWSQIDVQLKRRHDLIPNLVETAKGYMMHERTTLENITKARNLAAQSATGSIGERAKTESALSSALGQFFVVVENYPNLKANENFLQVQEELTSTENKISFARQAYNDSAMELNTKIETIPTNFVANMCNFQKMEFFQIEKAEEREAPKVSFNP